MTSVSIAFDDCWSWSSITRLGLYQPLGSTREGGDSSAGTAPKAIAGAQLSAEGGEGGVLAGRRAEAGELGGRLALPRLARSAHHAHALRALVLDLPLLDDEALGVAVVVLLARADAAEGGDFLFLLLCELALRRRRFEDAAGNVVVNARKLVARLPRAPGGPPLARARGLRLAPLPIEIDEQLLAGRLHPVFAERELRRRLALAQQRHTVAQALGELAGIEGARLTRVLRAPIGACV